MIDFRKMIHPLVVPLTKSRVPHQLILHNPYHVDNHQPVIYAVNHSNSNDIPISCRAVQRHCWVLIGKQRLFISDRLFFFLNGAIWVDRKDKQDMQLAKDRIQEHLLAGKSLIWFPEGTWNLTDHLLMLPMKWGIINIAQKCQVPIIPIVLEYDSLKKQCAAYFGEPFKADGFSLQDGINALRDKMATLRWEAWEHKGVFSRQELNLEMERTKLYQAVTDYPPLDWDYEQSIIFDPLKT